MDSLGITAGVRQNRMQRRRSSDSMLDSAAAEASANVQNGHKTTSGRRRTLETISRHVSRQSADSPAVMEATGSGRALGLIQRPCPCARIVNFCVRTALHLPSTQLAVCPNPLRKKLYFHAHKRGGADGQYRMEENGLDYYPEAPSFGDDDEEFTSGDEDDFTDGRSLARESASSSPSAGDMQHNALGSITNETSGNLAFGRRKLKFFDQISAQDREEARSHLKRYLREVYKRRFVAKLKHHKQGLSEDDLPALYVSELEAGVDEVEFPSFSSGKGGSVGGIVRSELAAAFILESLSICPKESVEGMADCYDGMVAAGAALIEYAERESRVASGTSGPLDDAIRNSASEERSSGESTSLNTSDPSSVLNTLTPLLITTLESTSGEVILALAQLYNLCATARYKRRLVQRIAPHLIRPPNAATWCLKHQNDMSAITAVTDLVLRKAGEIFSANWVERGKFLKADGLRAESLRLAALQLKNLNTRNRLNSLSIVSTKGGVAGTTGSLTGAGTGSASHGALDGSDHSHLAEWEVLAVDRYIRRSIRHVFERTWVNVKTARPASRGVGSANSIAIPVASVSSGTGTSGGGCPMSPRKIPLSPSTFSNSSNNSSGSTTPATLVSLPVMESTPGPPSGSSLTSSGHAISSEVPQTPKPSGPGLINNALVVGTPPRSPCSPPKPGRTVPNGSNLSSTDGTSTAGMLNAPQIPNMTLPGSAMQSPSFTSASSGSAGSSPRKPMSSKQPVVHHTLTKNTEERKRTVAACRALRAQIARFEETFAAAYGRTPKGAAERAPLATTYAQYREWKRAIRADAATRIQALFRGARCRWKLLRSKSPRMMKVVKPPRSTLSSTGTPMAIPGAHMADNCAPMMDDVVLSVGPGSSGNVLHGMHNASGSHIHMNVDVEERSCVSTEGVELIITPTGGVTGSTARRYPRADHIEHDADYSRPSGSNKWSPNPGRSTGSSWQFGRMRKGGKKERGNDVSGNPVTSIGSGDTHSTANLTENTSSTSVGESTLPYNKNNYHGASAGNFPKMQPKYSRIRNSSQGNYQYISSGNSVDSDNESEASQSSRGSYSASGSTGGSTLSMGDSTVNDLLVQKRDLKAQLKSYDMHFARKHGRMPVKAEKEPIRHLYEQYNTLKAHITSLEHAGVPLGQPVGGSTSMSGTTRSQPGGGTLKRGGGHVSMNSSAASHGSSISYGSSDRSVESSEDENSRGMTGYPSSRRHKGKGSTNNPAHLIVDASDMVDSGSGGGTNSSGSAQIPQDLSALRAEKGTLHQMLRSYEKQFLKDHNRQVSSFADIRPVASQYRRYKEIKKAIAALQAAEK